IGGGFSGAATAAQLLEAHRGPDTVHLHLIERRGTVGEGAAYGTREPEHLLNVPARNMGLLAGDPTHFLRWLQARDPHAEPATFAPRQLYGTYVRETLDAAIRGSAGHATVSMHLDEARRVVRRPEGGWLVHLARGESIAADAVVLAPGHRPPGDPLAGRWEGSRQRWIADPWRPHAVADIQPDEPVAIIGSGLSAVDVLMSLTGTRAPRRSSPIWMLSRNGLVPRVHHDPPQPAADLAAAAEPLLASDRLGARQLLKWLRVQLGAGRDWRHVIDGLRPHTAALWHRLPTAERARFIRHLQGFWEVHRHRTAASVGRHVERMLGDGSLEVVRCRIDHARASDDAVELSVQAWRRGQPHQSRRFRAAWVINCTGPAAAHRGDADPAVRSLVDAGLARPDPLGLGLETSPSGEVLDHTGATQTDLLVVGTLRKPALWESTAVPELRAQAAMAAQGALKAIFA
ncbi:MAG: FAD/NAD(P)-binding protein, partial [Planctomycetota bacterium]